MIDRHKLFDTTRANLFGVITQSQVDGINDIVTEWEAVNNQDYRQLAYVLGTVYHESAATMQPVKEHGGEAYLKAKAYYPYYGRDLVQTTWLRNYEKVKEFSGIDVVTYPDLIGKMPLAAKVAVYFMNKGYFTGKKLSHFFNDTTEDWYHARRIINGLDKADLVASYGKKFYDGLQ
jgi:putative chitinase